MSFFQHGLIFLIRIYQAVVSPLLVAVLGPSAQCRFTPSCSQYALEAVRLHGAIMGGWLALRRLSRCHPWGGCGDDPTPAPFLRAGRTMARLEPRPTKNPGRARLQP